MEVIRGTRSSKNRDSGNKAWVPESTSNSKGKHSMKNDMLKSVSLLLVAATMAGCNAGGMIVKAAMAGDGSGSCSANAISGGVHIACTDGTSADLVAPAGATGPAGPQGPAGPSQYIVDRGGFSIGSSLVTLSLDGGSGNHGYVVVSDSTSNAVVRYELADGSMTTRGLYYQNPGCTGTPLVDSTPGNMVFANNGSLYKTNGSTGARNVVTASVLSQGMSCSNTGVGARWLMMAAPFTATPSIPASVNIPVSVQ